MLRVCEHLEPAVPEGRLCPWTFQLCEPINSLLDLYHCSPKGKLAPHL